jgi:hypothetical protein
MFVIDLSCTGVSVALWPGQGVCVTDDFRCPDCGSPALVYPKVLKDDEPITCSSCGALVFTYGELKRRSELVLASKNRRVPLSGC